MFFLPFCKKNYLKVKKISTRYNLEALIKQKIRNQIPRKKGG